MEMLLTLTFVLSFIFIIVLIKLSQTLGLQDIPNSRSSHKKIIPRSAGLGFTSAVLISLLICDFAHMVEYFEIYISIFFIMIVGLIDDRFCLSHRVKFLALSVIIIYIVLNGLQIYTLGTYMGISMHLPVWLSILFSVFAIIGFSNALNLMDGLDGLASGLSIVMLVTFFMIGFLHNDELMITLSLTFIITLIAFLIFNWYPAKIFMGDSGSLTLGFTIAVLAVKSLEYMAPSSVLFIVGLPLMDTFIVMRRRMQRGISPFLADKNHLHHFLYKHKLDVRISVMLLLYIQLAFSIIGYQMRGEDQILSLTLFGLMLFLFLAMFDQRFRYRTPRKKVKNKEEGTFTPIEKKSLE